MRTSSVPTIPYFRGSASGAEPWFEHGLVPQSSVENNPIERRRAIRLGWAALFAFLCVTRLPRILFGPVNIDETDFLTVGASLVDGSLKHIEVLPSGIPLSYLYFNLEVLATLLSPAWLDPGQLSVLLAIPWIFLTCIVLGAAASRWIGNPFAGLLAGWVYALIISTVEPSVNAEITMNLPASLALYAFIRADDRPKFAWDLAAGAMAGFATLAKQQGGILIVALSAAVILNAVLGRSRTAALNMLQRLVGLSTGFLVPITLAAALFFELVAAGFLSPQPIVHHLMQATPPGWVTELGEGLLKYALLAAPMPWYGALMGHALPRLPVARALVLCLWLTWIPVSLGLRFYDHYFLQFAPVLALLATPWLKERLLVGTKARFSTLMIVLLLLLPAAVSSAVFTFAGLSKTYPYQDERTIAVAKWLRENTSSSARMFVWGHYTPIYTLSGRLPGTRYRNASVLVGDYDPCKLPQDFNVAENVVDAEMRALLYDLESQKVEIVVDLSPTDLHCWSPLSMEAVPQLTYYVRQHYYEAARPGGAIVYLRR